MKRFIFRVLLYSPFALNAQTENQYNGIRFLKELSWNNVLAKAKSENKYIFVDCFATWCGPCKAMDRNVFSQKELGDSFNNQFISIRVQMDRTDNDDDYVKKWYVDAKNICSNFNVNAFPTFLFFSPNGAPLHKAVGYRNAEELILLLKDALDPQKQYYKLLSNFQAGIIDTSELKGLAMSLRFSGNELAGKIAADYLTRKPLQSLGDPNIIQFMIDFNRDAQVQRIAVNYLSIISGHELFSETNLKLIKAFKEIPGVQEIAMRNIDTLDIIKSQQKGKLELLRIFKRQNKAIETANKYISNLNGKEMFTTENIEFIADFTTSSKDIGFAFFYRHSTEIDMIMRDQNRPGIYYSKKYAEDIVDNIIKSEEINPLWNAALERKGIHWKKVYMIIKKKYSAEYADRNILQAKVALYKFFAQKYNRNWKEYIKCNIRLINNYGTDTTSGYIDVTIINNFCWNAIFFHNTNKKQINIAIKWMEGVVRRGPTEETRIDTYANLIYKKGVREKAIELEKMALKIAIDKKDIYSVKLFQETIAKMKRGEPTWVKYN